MSLDNNVELSKYLILLYQLQPHLFKENNRKTRQNVLGALSKEIKSNFNIDGNEELLKRMSDLLVEYHELKKEKLPDETLLKETMDELSGLYKNLPFLEKRSIRGITKVGGNLRNGGDSIGTGTFLDIDSSLIELHNNDNLTSASSSTTESEKSFQKRKRLEDERVPSIMPNYSNTKNIDAYIDRSMSYLGTKLKQMKDPNVSKKIIRALITMLHSLQDQQLYLSIIKL